MTRSSFFGRGILVCERVYFDLLTMLKQLARAVSWGALRASCCYFVFSAGWRRARLEPEQRAAAARDDANSGATREACPCSDA